MGELENGPLVSPCKWEMTLKMVVLCCSRSGMLKKTLTAMAMRAKQMSKSAILHRQWQSLHRQRYTLKYFKSQADGKL